jgi:molybdate transport system substrate-binding protein
MKPCHLQLAAAVLLGLVAAGVAGQEHAPAPVRVAASDGLQAVMPELQEGFTEWSGLELSVTYGASGVLSEQIEKGSSYDVFLAADMEGPRKLTAHHLAEKNSLFRYAVGRLVLWAPNSGHLDLRSWDMQSLLQPSVNKIAVSDPQHDAYGQAAIAALKRLKLYAQVAPKLLLCESNSQAARRTESGEAQVAFLPLALVFAAKSKLQGTYFQVPIDAYPPLDQGAVVLAKAQNREAAEKFTQYLRRLATSQIFKKYGFVEPPNLGQ